MRNPSPMPPGKRLVTFNRTTEAQVASIPRRVDRIRRGEGDRFDMSTARLLVDVVSLLAVIGEDGPTPGG